MKIVLAAAVCVVVVKKTHSFELLMIKCEINWVSTDIKRKIAMQIDLYVYVG